MRRGFFLGVWLWSLSVPVFAACQTLDRTTWTARQRTMTEAIAYRLHFEAGEDIIPTLQGETICFPNSTVDLPTVLTEQAILDRFAQDEAIRQAARAADAVRQDALRQEVRTNNLCTAELEEITNRIDARIAAAQSQLDAAANLAQVKAHLRDQLYPAIGQMIQAVTRCLKARTDAGVGQ